MVSHDPKRPQPTNAPPLATTQSEPLAPHPPADIPKWVEEAIPRLDLVIENVLCPGATRFLAAIQPASLLRDAVIGVLLELYDEESIPSGVNDLSLTIKETEGVAATSGHTHKTIIFNAKYIEKLGSRARDEIMGVVRHEVVHCFQHDAHGTAPIGLIEGIADFVRLRAELSPPHWKRGNKGEHWDAGYEKTGFFLDWLEQAKGAGTVRRINLELSHGRYHRKKFWKNVLGETIEDLWEQYKATD